MREFAAMNFPTAKSLVVFGLSDVLLNFNCLDELLKEAGVEADLGKCIGALCGATLPRGTAKRS